MHGNAMRPIHPAKTHALPLDRLPRYFAGSAGFMNICMKVAGSSGAPMGAGAMAVGWAWAGAGTGVAALAWAGAGAAWGGKEKKGNPLWGVDAGWGAAGAGEDAQGVWGDMAGWGLAGIG